MIFPLSLSYDIPQLPLSIMLFLTCHLVLCYCSLPSSGIIFLSCHLVLRYSCCHLVIIHCHLVLRYSLAAILLWYSSVTTWCYDIPQLPFSVMIFLSCHEVLCIPHLPSSVMIFLSCHLVLRYSSVATLCYDIPQLPSRTFILFLSCHLMLWYSHIATSQFFAFYMFCWLALWPLAVDSN